MGKVYKMTTSITRTELARFVNAAVQLLAEDEDTFHQNSDGSFPITYVYNEPSTVLNTISMEVGRYTALGAARFHDHVVDIEVADTQV